MKLCNDTPSRFARATFAFLMALAWCGFPGGAVAQGEDSAAPPSADQSDPSPAKLHQAAEQISRMADDLIAADRQLPRTTFDESATVARVGKDPQKLLAWVRQRTAWAPYQGALRGSSGVLMDRTGNSLDRALLLARLLQIAGFTARLAHAQLDADAAGRFVAAAPTTQPDANDDLVDAPAQEAETLLDSYATSHAIDARQLRANLTALKTHTDKMAEDVGQGVGEQVPVLAAQVKSDVKGSEAAANAAAIRAAADHWWVQQDDAGHWADMDPMMQGSSDPRPDRTLELDPKSGKIPLDPALFHTVTVRVIAEQWQGGKLTSRTALEQPLRTAELSDRSIMFSQIPVDWPGDLDIAAEKDVGRKVRELAIAQHEWVPALRIAGQTVTQGGILDDGSIDPKPVLDSLGKTGKSVAAGARKAAAFDVFDTSPPPAPKPDSALTAEWIEFEVASPGRPSVIVRRPIFDLLGAAVRADGAALAASPSITDAQRTTRGLAMLGGMDILPLGSQPSAEFVQHLATGSLVDNRDSITDLLTADPHDTRRVSGGILRITPFPAALYEWALLRGVWDPHQDKVYLDRPNLVCLRQEPLADPAGNLSVRKVLDIVHNSIAVRGIALADSFVIRMEQGVLDTNLEALALSNFQGAGTATVFRHAIADGSLWTTLYPGGPADEKGLDVPSDVKAAISADLKAGYAVVLPKNAVTIGGRPALGWYRVDPASGDCLGMNQFGGADMVEFAMWFWAIVSGVTSYLGCAGHGASDGKKQACVVCATVAAIITAITVVASAGAGGWAGNAGKALGSYTGTQAGTAGTAACSMVGYAAD